jgi:sterol desaturase/sphingolipid hydroxylase (fatty acid hydroxylase superfamily)
MIETLVDLFLPLPNAWGGLAAWAVIVFAIFAGDFVGYRRHWLEHAARLWPSRAVHRSNAETT